MTDSSTNGHPDGSAAPDGDGYEPGDHDRDGDHAATDAWTEPHAPGEAPDGAAGLDAWTDPHGAGEAPDGAGGAGRVGPWTDPHAPGEVPDGAASVGLWTEPHDPGEAPGGAAGAGAEADPGDVIRAAAKRALEALVLVAEDPLTTHLLGQLLELSPVVVDTLCRELAAEYEDQGRGFQLVEVAGGWRYQSHPDQSPYVERLVLEGQTAKLSAAALETLAIVAYKQPVSRAQVAAIRGVSVDGVMRTLQQRGYIDEIGKDPGPGQAVLFGTTRTFLEKLGLNDVDDLPPLGDFVPGADVVEQLERGLRPDREPWRPEDVLPPAEGDAGGFDDADDLDGDGADADDDEAYGDAATGVDVVSGLDPDGE